MEISTALWAPDGLCIFGVHMSAGMVGGHYTTYALNYVNLSWYEYDDQIVTEVDPQQVENCEAYVLFYRFDTCLNVFTHQSVE